MKKALTAVPVFVLCALLCVQLGACGWSPFAPEDVEEPFTVTFDPNGGGGAAFEMTFERYASKTLPECPFEAPGAGDVFTGWATKADGTGGVYRAGAPYAAYGDVTFYAVWRTVSYTVTFDPNGGVGEKMSTIFTAKTPTALPACSFSPAAEDLLFDGWNTVSDGSGTSYAEGEMYEAESDATLYAQWRSTLCTVTLEPNGGGGEPVQVAFTIGVPQKMVPNPFSAPASNMFFGGWNTAPDGSGVMISNKSEFTAYGDTTLYATWTYTLYTVTFDPNGGTGEKTVQEFTAGVISALDPCPFEAPEGYRFAGWNTKKDGSGSSYRERGNFLATRSVKLYAQWRKETYTVTFKANGGSGDSYTQTVQDEVPAVLEANRFKEPENATFTGWNTKKDGSGTAYEPGREYTLVSDLTLYAQWQYEATPTPSDGKETGSQGQEVPSSGQETESSGQETESSGQETESSGQESSSGQEEISSGQE